MLKDKIKIYLYVEGVYDDTSKFKGQFILV